MRRWILWLGLAGALVACVAIVVVFPDVLMTAAMSLYLVPRPLSLLLLAVGVVVLAIAGFMKRRKS
jgi:hypothetical protein